MDKYIDSHLDYSYAGSNAQEPSFYNHGVQYTRDTFKEKFALFPTPKNPRLITSLESFSYDSSEIPIKIYKDIEQPIQRGGTPCIIYAHGGGFVTGGFELVDGLCQDFVFDLGITVIAVDYRSAPEFKHPTALYDCMEAIQYIMNNAEHFGINPGKIYLGGESSGGFIAVTVPIMLRDKGLPQIAGVISINPVLDTCRWANREVNNCSQEFQDEMFFLTSNYLGLDCINQPEYASALAITDLTNLPPILLFAAKSDPLSSEAALMSKKLLANGVVTYTHIDEDALHGCIRARRYYRFARYAYDALLYNIKKLIGN
ncbi:alpha/beta hydrolase [Klebsiella michiganensis]|uniref:alpha/beta hydrolase n=1 Tax=Klebsiella michiganensis TaxID=1134687 RepID=UPI0032DA829B